MKNFVEISSMKQYCIIIETFPQALVIVLCFKILVLNFSCLLIQWAVIFFKSVKLSNSFHRRCINRTLYLNLPFREFCRIQFNLEMECLNTLVHLTGQKHGHSHVCFSNYISNHEFMIYFTYAELSVTNFPCRNFKLRGHLLCFFS